MRNRHTVMAGLLLVLLAGPAAAQIAVLDSAQDRAENGEAAPEPAASTEPAAPTEAAPPPPSGSQNMTIARMS